MKINTQGSTQPIKKKKIPITFVSILWPVCVFHFGSGGFSPAVSSRVAHQPLILLN